MLWLRVMFAAKGAVGLSLKPGRGDDHISAEANHLEAHMYSPAKVSKRTARVSKSVLEGKGGENDEESEKQKGPQYSENEQYP